MKDIERKVEEIKKAREEMSFEEARKKEAEILNSSFVHDDMQAFIFNGLMENNARVNDDFFSDKFDEF